MWLIFFVGVVIYAAILYIPGFVQLRSVGIGRNSAFSCAPLVSLAELSLLGVVFGLFAIPISGLGIVSALFVLTLTIATFIKAANVGMHKIFSLPSLEHIDIDLKNVLLYLGAGLGITGFLFLKTLDGPESYVQMFDNGFHLNLIAAFADTSRYSVLQSTIFPITPLEPMGDLAFYPSLWHVSAAVVANFLGITAAMAQNISLFVLCGMVLPVGMCAFLSEVFSRKKEIVPFGSVLVLSFATFPWGFLVAGPLYSNFASFALLPSVMFCFLCLIKYGFGKKRFFLLFLLGCVVLLFAQPNAIFTAIAILTPYVMHRIIENNPIKRISAPMVATLFFFAVIGLWIGLWSLSSGTVSYYHTPYANPIQALIDYFDLGGRNSVAQIPLALLILTGVIFSIHQKEYRWFLPSLVFFAIAFVIAASTSGASIETLLSGFWYNDVDRILAAAFFTMMPLASLGLFAVSEIVRKVFTASWGRENRKTVYGFVLASFLILNFLPNFILAGNGDITTAFGARYERLEELARDAKCLTDDEVSFISKCQEIADTDSSMIVNFPADGSVFAYATNNANTLYRHFFEEKDYEVISKHLSDVTTNAEVRNAVHDINLGYVLILDSAEDQESTIYKEHIKEEDWKGITGITKNTPGFTLLLSENGMEFYKITG